MIGRATYALYCDGKDGACEEVFTAEYLEHPDEIRKLGDVRALAVREDWTSRFVAPPAGRTRGWNEDFCPSCSEEMGG